MATVTIPKKVSEHDELVILPREEYEALLKLKNVQEFVPTKAQRKALRVAEQNLKRGKAISGNELARKLGFAD